MGNSYSFFHVAFIKKHPKWTILMSAVVLFIGLGFIPSQDLIIPVESATQSSYNAKSFWYYPWGKSGTHKGLDIFASLGTKVIAPCSGVIISTGTNVLGGNYVLMLSAKWRLHYFAHLSAIYTSKGHRTSSGEVIAAVGDSGNAKGKSPHLHYEIITIFPLFWQNDAGPQGYKKMWYINPMLCFKSHI